MRQLLCLLFIHDYKPVLNRYANFNFRWVVFKCSCCGKVKVEYVEHELIYPFEMLSRMEDSEYDKYIYELCKKKN